MAPKPEFQRPKDWYSISVETVRTGALVLVLLVASGVGYWLYHNWQLKDLERAAVRIVLEADGLEQQVLKAELSQAGNFAAEMQVARDHLARARVEIEKRAFRDALRDGRRSRDLLRMVLDASTLSASSGKAQFVSVQGEVEFRRAKSDVWEEARNRLALRPGDYVRTSSNGSAEIFFVDGTFYTVRPNTLFVVTRSVGADGAAVGGEQAIRMEYGWVNLNTSQRPSEIQTPSARARVREASEASVAYDQGNARFAALRGSIELSSGGAQREVKELQEVVQEGSRLSTPRPLPGAPTLSEPAENQQFTLDSKQPMVLGWEAATNAARYALQVSRTREFLDTVLDVENRTTTRATLGLRGEGIFSWRVAAISREGAQGPWSTPRQFRVVRAERPGDVDKTPPQLELENVKLYGNLVILAGRTEPGAVLRVNGETVAIDAEGAFTKTVQFTREGWNFVEVRSTDAWGNEAARRRRVFVEADL